MAPPCLAGSHSTQPTRTFSGTPDNAGTLSVKVTATDHSGASVSDTFDIRVTNVAGPTKTGTRSGEIINGTTKDETILGLGGADKLYGDAGKTPWMVAWGMTL